MHLRYRTYTSILLIYCVATSNIVVADMDSSAMASMANTMFNMMAEIGSRWPQTNINNPQQMWENMGWPPNANQWNWQSMPWSAQMPNSQPSNSQTYRTLERDAITTTELFGNWLNNNGERLTISNSNFYLQTRRGSVSGFLQVHERTLVLYQPRLHLTLYYEYAVSEGRLAMRDSKGQIFLYKRIR